MIFLHIFIPKLANKLFPSQHRNCNSGLTGTKQLTPRHTRKYTQTNTAVYYRSTRELNCLQDTLVGVLNDPRCVCVCVWLQTIFCICIFEAHKAWVLLLIITLVHAGVVSLSVSTYSSLPVRVRVCVHICLCVDQ